MPWMRNVFRPELRLGSQNALAGRLVEASRGLIPIDGFERRISTDRSGLGLWLQALIVVEVGIRIGRHDHVVARVCGCNSASHSSPGHHGCAWGKAAFENFVPADQSASVR